MQGSEFSASWATETGTGSSWDLLCMKCLSASQEEKDTHPAATYAVCISEEYWELRLLVLEFPQNPEVSR